SRSSDRSARRARGGTASTEPARSAVSTAVVFTPCVSSSGLSAPFAPRREKAVVRAGCDRSPAAIMRTLTCKVDLQLDCRPCGPALPCPDGAGEDDGGGGAAAAAAFWRGLARWPAAAAPEPARRPDLRAAAAGDRPRRLWRRRTPALRAAALCRL